MKKNLFFSFFAIIFVFVLTACTSNDPVEVYEQAAAAYSEAKGVSITYDSQMQISDGTKTMEYSFAGETLIANGDSVAISQSGDVKIDLNVGNTVSVPVKTFYHEGALYFDLNESLYSKKMDAEKAMQSIGPICAPAVGLSQSDFKEITLKDNEDGTRTLSLIIFAGSSNKITGLAEGWKQIAGGGTISFKDVKGFITIKDEAPVQQSLTISGTIENGDTTYTVTERLVLNIGFADDIVPQIPDAEKYSPID